jgi:S-DNA-T family DNA segregation ATPase FtsK/SpoIIIE
MHKKLESMSDRIEAVLARHRIPARVTGGTVTPRWVRFQVLPAVGARLSAVRSLSEELAAALDVPGCRVSRQGAAVAIQVLRDDSQPVRLLPLFHQLTDRVPLKGSGPPLSDSPNTGDRIPPVTAILGLAEDGVPLLIRLVSPDVAHILVIGATGAGKTVLLQTMALSLAMANPTPGETNGRGTGLALLVVGQALSDLAGLPHLARPVIYEAEKALEALTSLATLMEKREATGENTPLVVMLIDELADVLAVDEQTAQRAVSRLVSHGRGAGIHVVAATRRPMVAIAQQGFPVRLVGRVDSIEQARKVTGWSGTGAERLMGQGDFLALAEGQVTRFQTAYVSPAEVREMVARLAQKKSLSYRPPNCRALTGEPVVPDVWRRIV